MRAQQKDSCVRTAKKISLRCQVPKSSRALALHVSFIVSILLILSTRYDVKLLTRPLLTLPAY